ncbi:MAG: ATPase [Parcubacteria group bacterium CG11_big_fil_rev_8_21_14_0_20_39_22]|nr:MAG: ATPase [Parcubacteria group bacterium CG11_big_fil_rev_8_21_14_0_20_39_22]
MTSQKEIFIRKANGEDEPFDPHKLEQSLQRADAPEGEIVRIVEHIKNEIVQGMTTEDIYRHAFNLLKKEKRSSATKYSLRRALAALGPSGYPFEAFLGELYKRKGYTISSQRIIKGKCAEHELDMVAYNDQEVVVAEAKFHTEHHFKTDLKTSLYVKARFDDIKDSAIDIKGSQRKIDRKMLITNTKFTTTAIDYAQCAGLELVGWSYPGSDNLEDMIEKSNVHPITALTLISESEKNILLSQNIVICRNVLDNPSLLKVAGIKKSREAEIINEINTL